MPDTSFLTIYTNTYICVFFLLVGNKANHFHLVFPNFSLFLFFLLFEKEAQISKGGGSVATNGPPTLRPGRNND